MAYRNYLNLPLEERDKSIYRIMRASYLIDMIEGRRNALSKPCLWNDPFENFILQSRAKLRDGRTALYGMRDEFFGQCWTLRRESDAMWRIYSQDNNGAKIRTTIRKLYSSLYNAVNPSRKDVSCFIGKVEYFSREAIRRYLERPINLESSGAGIAETLLIKRLAFSHEREVRLIYWAQEKQKETDLFQYEIDPNELIEEIVFDSRLSEKSYGRYKTKLRALEYKGRIIQSSLYKAPENVFTMLPE